MANPLVPRSNQTEDVLARAGRLGEAALDFALGYELNAPESISALELDLVAAARALAGLVIAIYAGYGIDADG